MALGCLRGLVGGGDGFQGSILTSQGACKEEQIVRDHAGYVSSVFRLVKSAGVRKTARNDTSTQHRQRCVSIRRSRRVGTHARSVAVRSSICLSGKMVDHDAIVEAFRSSKE